MSDFISQNNKSEYARTSTAHITMKDDQVFSAEETILREIGNEFRGRAILDIGVGAGRSTGPLLNISSDYIGVDYSAAMVEVAQGLFPDVDMRCVDARDLSAFEDEQFDLVWFSFNGIDYVAHEDRLKILAEVYRVVKPNGAFCFSSHNRAYPIRQAHDLSHIKRSYNPVAVLKSGVFYLAGIYNTYSRKRHEVQTDEYAILNDEGNLYKLLTYYVSEEKQVEQLDAVGFATAWSYGFGGEAAEPGSGHRDSFMIYYLARPIATLKKIAAGAG